MNTGRWIVDSIGSMVARVLGAFFGESRVEEKENDGNTELMEACKQGKLDEATRLLQLAVSSNSFRATNTTRWNALHWAAFGGNPEIVEMLLRAGIHVDDPNGAQWTSLHIAAAQNHHDVASALLESGANVNALTPDDQSPLLICCANGFRPLARLLISNGADPSLATKKLENSLYYACLNGHFDIVAMLLDHDKTRSLIDAINMHGATSMHAACCGAEEKTIIDILRLLQRRGANVNAQKRDGCTPLHVAVIRNHPEVVKFLLREFPDIDVNLRSRFGTSVVHEASFLGRAAILESLLTHPTIDLSLVDNDGYSPLHSACSFNRPQTAEELEDRKKVLRLLVQRGMDINTLESSNCTALHIAACTGDIGFALIPVLLDLGADVTMENSQEWTALHLAQSSAAGNPRSAELLESKAPAEFLAAFDRNKPRKQLASKPSCSVSNEEMLQVNGGKLLSIEDIANKIKSGEITKIAILAGAGISTSAGIPDFRNPDSGIYSSSTASKYGLPSASSAFDPSFIASNPKPFYRIVKDTFYPVQTGQILPTPTHRFVSMLASKNLLLRLYTQNVDGLESKAGIPNERMIESHGGFSSAHCMDCGKQVDPQVIWDSVARDSVPYCTSCLVGVVRPDLTFFGEGLPKKFHEYSLKDMRECDLLIVMGTSLKVYPFASLVNDVRPTVPRLLINKEPVGPFVGISQDRIDKHFRDVCFEGSCDEGVIKLAELLCWQF